MSDWNWLTLAKIVSIILPSGLSSSIGWATEISLTLAFCKRARMVRWSWVFLASRSVSWTTTALIVVALGAFGQQVLESGPVQRGAAFSFVAEHARHSISVALGKITAEFFLRVE